MKNEYGFLLSASGARMSLDELVARDEGAGPFTWVRPCDISGIDQAGVLARNLKAREEPSSDLSPVDDVFPEASVCSYLESCVRHGPDRQSVDDVMDACVYIMVQWGSSLPAHGFYSETDLLSPGDASRILKIFRTVYAGLKSEVLRQNVRYFVGEHYRTSGVWILDGKSRFASALDSEDVEFISKINLDEMNCPLNHLRK